MRRWVDRLPWWGAAAFVVLAVVTLDRDPLVSRSAFRPYSVHNTSDAGLSLAYGYLSAGGRAATLSRPLERSFLEPDAVVFRIAPDSAVPPGLRASRAGAEEEGAEENPRGCPAKPPADGGEATRSMPLLTPEEKAWVRGGGRIVIAVNGAYASLWTDWRGDDEVRKVFPLWPGVEKLDLPGRRVLAGPALDGAVSVLATEKGPVVAWEKVGRGEAVVLACPEVFQNARIGKADHLPLLLALAAGRRAYFDEFVHGLSSDAGTIEVLRRWGFGPFLVVAAAACLVGFWRRRVRLGPEEDDARETRIEAVDLVDSLATLYGRALRRRQALAMYAASFQQAVALRTGLRGPALDAKARELLPSRFDVAEAGRDASAAEFARGLRQINEAFRRLDDAKRPGNRRTDEGARRTA